MRFLLFLAPLLSCYYLQAQVVDWSRVEALPQGTRLVVTTQHSLPCTLNQVSEYEIDCEMHGTIYPIDRSRILRISLSRPDKAVVLGTALGALAGGAIVGATDNNQDIAKGVRVIAGAGLGGCVGFLIGHVVGRSHGPVIYVRP